MMFPNGNSQVTDKHLKINTEMSWTGLRNTQNSKTPNGIMFYCKSRIHQEGPGTEDFGVTQEFLMCFPGPVRGSTGAHRGSQ